MRRNSREHSFPWHAHRTALVAAWGDEARRYLKEALTRAGYKTDVYADLGMIREERQTAGRSFLMLEQGVGTTDDVRRFRERSTRLPVILVSTGLPREVRGGDSLGYLSMPFTPGTLARAIADVTP